MKYIVLSDTLTSRPLAYVDALFLARDASRDARAGLVQMIENRGNHRVVAAFEHGRDVTSEILREFPNEHDPDDDGGELQPEDLPHTVTFFAH